MTHLPILLADLVAIAILAFGIYFPRHHRRDLVVAFLGVNIGVLAVATVLGSSTVGAGLGLGLFGVLSIIRLRSDEIAQHEVAYYFAALALGLIAGLSSSVTVLTVSLMILLLVTLFVGDHPRLFRRYRQQTMQLDVAYTDEGALRAHLELLLNARVINLIVKHVDLVNDTTLVEVRFVVGAPSRQPVELRRGDVQRSELERASDERPAAVTHVHARRGPPGPYRPGRARRRRRPADPGRPQVRPTGRGAGRPGQRPAGRRPGSCRSTGRRHFGYRSVYFDTPDLHSYLAAAQPRRHRFKVRIRSYLDSDQHFVEVKTLGRAGRRSRPAPVRPADRTPGPQRPRRVADVLRPELPPAGGGAHRHYRRTTLYLPDTGSRATIDPGLPGRPRQPSWAHLPSRSSRPSPRGPPARSTGCSGRSATGRAASPSTAPAWPLLRAGASRQQVAPRPDPPLLSAIFSSAPDRSPGA